MSKGRSEIQVTSCPPPEAVEAVKRLRKGDLLEVRWLDACSFRDVAKPEEIYRTPKTTMGRFHSFIDNHLILVTEEGLGV